MPYKKLLLNALNNERAFSYMMFLYVIVVVVIVVKMIFNVYSFYIMSMFNYNKKFSNLSESSETQQIPGLCPYFKVASSIIISCCYDVRTFELVTKIL